MTHVAALDGHCALPQLGVIVAEGPDAAAFLHGQLTQDFSLLDATQARLAALCTAKGRMIASMIGIRPQPETVVLVLGRDILPATLKRLQMYVLRAKLKLRDASDEFALFGLAGEALAANGLDPAAPAWRRTAVGDASVVSLYPADGTARALWIAPAGAAAPRGAALHPALWQWSEVRSGVATLSTPVLDAFVPQMLNYESVGGVNFKKGCYPGQEVVARSQFRGTLKRRGFLLHAAAPLTAGEEIFAAGDAEQPVGTVVQSAAAPQGGFEAIASLQVAAAEAGQLHADGAAAQPVTLLPLPYALLADI
ncbi:folate-binding protein [Variovorax sp.]|uniref:CAF17-like 4Fe-4S cluster assembly/insertion protein YgfZ n=1 Tax=Variovorax sp. TaxID=1871043 RepID=UPI002D58C81B|nr:folate-binding protein [Variovorax sp.]HYP86007.1 folate-binding protein [Variovorax sp.]